MSEELFVPSLITPEIVETILATKKYMPPTWKIKTEERGEDGFGFLVIIIEQHKFEQYNIWEKIRIAEQTNELCKRIEELGVRCVIERI